PPSGERSGEGLAPKRARASGTGRRSPRPGLLPWSGEGGLPQYVALLGSINVGGNRLKMDALRAALEEAGLAKVQTVVASGNVLFEHDRAPDAALERKIAEVVRERFGIDSFAAVRTRAELKSAI